MDRDHPALAASRESWRCVQSGDKQAWLDLMAEDICMEDPIGRAPTNPDGQGIRGKAAISVFWDKHIGPAQIEIETQESFAAGLEAAHRMKLTTCFENGVRTIVEGIFTYTVNEDRQLTQLRGYWAMEDMRVEKPG